MLEVAGGRRTPRHALADGNALRSYPAFDLPARALLAPPDPEVERYGCRMLVAPRTRSALTLGDARVDDAPGLFASDEAADEYLLASARRPLAGRIGEVRHRWQGTYLHQPGSRGLYLRAWVADGVLAVTALGELGMTAAPAVAADAVARLSR